MDNVKVSNGVLNGVDNYALQKVLELVKKAKLKEEDFIKVQLNRCPHCQKQRMFLNDMEQKILGDQVDIEECFFCNNPVDIEIYIYCISAPEKQKGMILCTEEEMKAMMA